MRATFDAECEALRLRSDAEWRNPLEVISQWDNATGTDRRLLHYRVHGAWWETLAASKITLFVTREYDHLVMAMYAGDEGPVISYLPLPHPSGLVIDRERDVVHIASTRNPNQVFDLVPVEKLAPRLGQELLKSDEYPLVPVRSRFFPGCLYTHDLALISGNLYANAVGQNAVVRLWQDGHYERVWWPRCIDTETGPVFGKNHIQLNSIAAGGDLSSSFFSASSDRVAHRRPGHRNYAVDKRGVIFSGSTREPVVRGLTRPHSARLYNGRIWVNNSGYGEFGCAESGRFNSIIRMPGWTRGLCFFKGIAFVGTSRILAGFRQYAPGLEESTSLCGVHAVDMVSGEIVGSLIWPFGNQVFGIDWGYRRIMSGFTSIYGKRRVRNLGKNCFFTFKARRGHKTDK